VFREGQDEAWTSNI
jgi:hypothetical protein